MAQGGRQASAREHYIRRVLGDYIIVIKPKTPFIK